MSNNTNNTLNKLKEQELANKSKKVKDDIGDDIFKSNAFENEYIEEITTWSKVKSFIGLDKGWVYFLTRRVLVWSAVIVVSTMIGNSMGKSSTQAKYATPKVSAVKAKRTLADDIDNLRKDEISALQSQIASMKLASSDASSTSAGDDAAYKAIIDANNSSANGLDAFFTKITELTSDDAGSLGAIKSVVDASVNSQSYEASVLPAIKMGPSIEFKTKVIKTTPAVLSLFAADDKGSKAYLCTYYFVANNENYLATYRVVMTSNKMTDLKYLGSHKSDIKDNMFNFGETFFKSQSE
jgi:hypothetical protein